ncbi:unnamed protein product [Didymodactylos carnosus]|uniref:Mitochondrial ribosomal protein S36 n=1 Tax=Didymodactylos carnosus TaxID=1234261 RepID=A0A814SYN7_9BILA|nr:unnamed protein product [Didymodactylos carnosus]CAF1154408.1 unnamed protein product [Didymodactylos carnosus]CAF3711351.1 unnamed protein product [Didymodactylos carnosus]CAF3917842.1 unnamed protein product [Didymodactylos carnosus]
MASVASTNLQKILRHHVPLIKFKFGSNGTGSIAHSKTINENESKSPSGTSINMWKITEKSPTVEFTELPKRYRRRPLTQDEIDLVTRGGPA